MECSVGDLSFVTDGVLYTCVWHPQEQDFRGPKAVIIAAVHVGMIKDSNDFKCWQKEVTGRWAEVAKKLLGTPDTEFTFEPIRGTTTN